MTAIQIMISQAENNKKMLNVMKSIIVLYFYF